MFKSKKIKKLVLSSIILVTSTLFGNKSYAFIKNLDVVALNNVTGFPWSIVNSNGIVPPQFLAKTLELTHKDYFKSYRQDLVFNNKAEDDIKVLKLRKSLKKNFESDNNRGDK